MSEEQATAEGDLPDDLPIDVAKHLLALAKADPLTASDAMFGLLDKICGRMESYVREERGLAAQCRAARGELAALRRDIDVGTRDLERITRSREEHTKMGYEARRKIDAMLHGVNLFLIKFAGKPPIDTNKWLTDLRARIDDLPEPHNYAAAIDRFFDKAGWFAAGDDQPKAEGSASDGEDAAE